MQGLILGRAGNIYRETLHKTSLNYQKCFQIYTKTQVSAFSEVTETGLSCICRLLAMAVLAVASCGAVESTRPAPQNILVQRKSNWCSVHSALRSSNVYRKNILEENSGSVAEEIKSSKINTYFR